MPINWNSGAATATATTYVNPSTTNTYGSTLIDTSGTGAVVVVASNPGALSSGALSMGAGGTLSLSSYSFSFANLNGTGGVIQNNLASSASIITVGSDNTSTVYAGTLIDGAAVEALWLSPRSGPGHLP